jgi:hypothetical protein
MGFFQATNGIDSKTNVLVTGSLFASTNVNAVGTVSGSNISSSGDIIAGEDVFIQGIDVLSTGFTSGVNSIVAISDINGQLYSITSNPTGLNISNSYNLTFHRSSNSSTYYFSGKTQSVSFYNKALSAQEILQNYNATKSRFNLP